MPNEHTVPDKIITCALELDSEKGTFTAEDLVVRCWKRYPQTFGLQGYAESYPDSNRILTNIMGSKGLRGKGWLRKVGEKRYRMTEVGRQAASRLGQSSPEQRAGSLTKQQLDVLERLVSSRAFQKYRIGQELSFGDLCTFLNISPRSNAYQLNVASKEVENAMAAAAGFIGSTGNESLLLPGATAQVAKADLQIAQRVYKHLLDVFARELEVIKERSDERLRR